MKAGRFARVGTRLSAREQLRACVKWDLVVRDSFIFSNFVRQYFRFRSVNFFQIFDATKINRMPIYTSFLKNSVGGKKIKKAKGFYFHLPYRIFLNLHIFMIIPNNM